MSNTTSPARTFTGDTGAFPEGMVLTHVLDLMEDHGLTEKAAYALAWRDGDHGTNAEGGASMDGVFGAAVKAGGFGNTVTGALRKAGREGEVTSAPRSTGPKVTSFADYVATYRRTMEAKREALIKAADDARAPLDGIDAEPQVYIDDEVARLQSIIDHTKAEMVALKKDPSSYLDSLRAQYTHAADSLATARDAGLATIEAELKEAGVA